MKDNLPGFTSDILTKMDREKLEEYLDFFNVDAFNDKIEQENITELMVNHVNQDSKAKYSKIISNATWQGPFFYGGSNIDTYGYFSFATITDNGDFGGWWLVFWKNGTIRLTQNIATGQVGRLVTVGL